MENQKRTVTVIAICALLLLTSCSSGPEITIQGPNAEIDGPNTKAASPTKMITMSTQELIPGIFTVESGISNFYLIKSGDSYIAIDAGEHDSKSAKKKLDLLNISSDDVAALFLTHTDFDHIGAISLFDKATVYYGGRIVPGRESMENGETVKILDSSVQCTYARGHRRDSVYYIIDGKYLFSGDNLGLLGNHVKLFISAYNDSDEVQEEDIMKLSTVEGIQYIFTGHHGYTDNPVFPQAAE